MVCSKPPSSAHVEKPQTRVVTARASVCWVWRRRNNRDDEEAVDFAAADSFTVTIVNNAWTQQASPARKASIQKKLKTVEFSRRQDGLTEAAGCAGRLSPKEMYHVRTTSDFNSCYRDGVNVMITQCVERNERNERNVRHAAS